MTSGTSSAGGGLSVCVAVKDRSKIPHAGSHLELFPNCVGALAEALGDVASELVVADWSSTDWPLTEWLPERAGSLPWTVVTVERSGFSKGLALNKALAAARYDDLFFVDADTLPTRQVINEGLNYLKQGKVMSPRHWAQQSHGSTEGKHIRVTGNLFVKRGQIEQAGRWPEYWRWGGEDVMMLEMLKHRGFDVLRKSFDGFVHQWHPSNVGWKDRFVRGRTFLCPVCGTEGPFKAERTAPERYRIHECAACGADDGARFLAALRGDMEGLHAAVAENMADEASLERPMYFRSIIAFHEERKKHDKPSSGFKLVIAAPEGTDRSSLFWDCVSIPVAMASVAAPQGAAFQVL